MGVRDGGREKELLLLVFIYGVGIGFFFRFYGDRILGAKNIQLGQEGTWQGVSKKRVKAFFFSREKLDSPPKFYPHKT